MSATQVYKTVTNHNGGYVWQRTALGKPFRSPVHFKTAEEAAVDSDLVAFYFRTVWKLDLPTGMDPEQWSSLIYSRRHVALADCQSVEKALHTCVKEFVAKHRVELEAHRDSQPAETLASKLRRSWNFNNQPEVRDYVNKLEQAEDDATAFAQIDSDSFFLRLKVVDKSLSTALNSLRLAIKMHSNAANPRLVQRGKNLAELVHNFQLNVDYVKDLTANLRAEETNVRSAVAELEATRPALV